jgi:hypothetical protein
MSDALWWTYKEEERADDLQKIISRLHPLAGSSCCPREIFPVGLRICPAVLPSGDAGVAEIKMEEKFLHE